jgi:hypothetical protein
MNIFTPLTSSLADLLSLSIGKAYRSFETIEFQFSNFDWSGERRNGILFSLIQFLITFMIRFDFKFDCNDVVGESCSVNHISPIQTHVTYR